MLDDMKHIILANMNVKVYSWQRRRYGHNDMVWKNRGVAQARE